MRISSSLSVLTGVMLAVTAAVTSGITLVFMHGGPGKQATQQVERGATEAVRNASASTDLSASVAEIKHPVVGLEQITEALAASVGRIRI